MTVNIRDAVPSDRDVIADFNSRLSEETEGRPLDPSLIAIGVEKLLHDVVKGRYWLAEADAAVVGQIMVTHEWSDWRNGVLWWIQSAYVREDFRRQSIFSKLYRHVESLDCAERGVVGLRLYVEAENVRAQETYRKLGMTMTGYRVMQSLLKPNT